MEINFDIGAYAAFKSTSSHFKQPLDTAFGPDYRHVYIITYVTKGKGYYKVDGKTYTVNKGDSFIVYPGKLIHYYPDPDDKWEYVWVDFNGKEVEELLSHTAFSINNPVVRKKSHHKIYKYFSLLSDLFEYSTEYTYTVKKLNRKALLYQLIAEYIKTYPAIFESDLAFKDRMSDYIYRKYSDPSFQVESIEKHFSMSHVTLYRYFKENFNSTPKKYINSLRISKASKLLHDKTLQIKDVAFSVGFKDPLYFSRVFKEETGYAPSEYNEKHVIPNLPFKVDN